MSHALSIGLSSRTNVRGPGFLAAARNDGVCACSAHLEIRLAEPAVGLPDVEFISSVVIEQNVDSDSHHPKICPGVNPGLWAQPVLGLYCLVILSMKPEFSSSAINELSINCSGLLLLAFGLVAKLSSVCTAAEET